MLATCHCNNNGDCVAGTCNTETNACECGSDDDCPGTQLCDAVRRECVAGCTGDAQCEAGERCTVDNACAIPECAADSDCGANQRCSAAFTCTAGGAGSPCETQAQCGDGFYCDLTSYRCRDGALFDACDPELGCNANLACVDGGVCSDGALGRPCDPGSCAAPYYCGADARCHDGSLGDPCNAPADCGGASYCGPDGRCHNGSLGDGCNSDDDCQGGDLYCETVTDVSGSYARCQPLGTCAP